MDTQRFANRNAVITGAGSKSGIGFAAARKLGLGGARIGITSTTDRIFERVSELKALGIDVCGYVADLMDRPQVDALCANVLSELGPVHILVNNAGMVQVGQVEESSAFVNLRQQAWHESIDRNLTTCFNVTQELLPGMIRQRYGRIVNVSSVTGPVVSNPASAPYSAAKAAMVGMSRSIALDVGDKGITINNVAPGWISSGSQLPQEAVGGFNTPLRRSGTPDEVADLIAFLASDESSYITGQLIIIDGGNTLQEYKGPVESYY
ncbi:MAG: SDR family oxidoreductase [Gammaproteobacteria bacterium]|nr:SDR family oxidoreductase [Gammaproteobacteria bacterium]